MSLDAVAPDAGWASYSTGDVGRDDSPAYWTSVLSKFFGPLEAQVLDENGGEASLTTLQLSFLRMFRIKMCSSRVTHDGGRRESWTPDGVKLLLQMRGGCIVEQGGSSVECGEEEWILFDPAMPYSVTNIGDVEQVLVTIPRERLFDRRFPKLASPFVADAGRSQMARVVSSFVLSWTDGALPANEGVAEYLAETAVGLLRCQLRVETGQRTGEQRMPDILRLRIKQFVASRLGDPDLSIDQVAAAMGCSKRYIHMVFEPEGTTVERLIWQQRIDRCCKALADADQVGKSVSEIAFRWGFNSSAHFCRMFKSQVGVSPTAFRRDRGARARHQ